MHIEFSENKVILEGPPEEVEKAQEAIRAKADDLVRRQCNITWSGCLSNCLNSLLLLLGVILMVLGYTGVGIIGRWKRFDFGGRQV